MVLKLIQYTEEPPCRSGFEHSYFELGYEDNGEKVLRCGNCFTLKYEGNSVHYEKPE